MLDYENFISKSKSLVIAPAGYGKTHTIAESILYAEGKQLILTHTHAGVASIKEKLKKNKVNKTLYNVETISSFTQRYANAFTTKENIPNQEDSKNYYPFIIKEATRIVKIAAIADVIRSTYTGLFVDEYQDCTIEQHEFIIAMANVLPTRILGDFLQGIFDFTGQMVNLEDNDLLEGFAENKYTLTTPWRWKKTNEQLGESLKDIRARLIESEEISLDVYKAIEFIKISSSDVRNFGSIYFKVIWSLFKEESLLIIHPDSANIHSRLKFVKTFKNKFRLIESIDDNSFYNIARQLDDSTIETIPVIIRDICLQLFNKTGINVWFNDKGLKKKTKDDDKRVVEPIKLLMDNLIQADSINYQKVATLLSKVITLPKLNCYRKEIFKNICTALIQAHKEKITVYDAMLKNRNAVRMLGRKVYGKCLGTTLLTKGLEFDTVLVLHADRFKCPKNFYVAITRASKRLIIISQKERIRLPRNL